MDLYIDSYGTKIGTTGERITLSSPDKQKKEYPIRWLKKIVLQRPAALTTHAMQLALRHDVDIVCLGDFGMPLGRIVPSEPKGLANVRRAQLEVCNSPEKSMELLHTLLKERR